MKEFTIDKYKYEVIKNVDNYIKNNCAYNCKHFIVKKCVQK